MANMTIVDGAYHLQVVPTNAAQTKILTTENKFVDKNIVLEIPGATSATGPILNITNSTATVSVSNSATDGFYSLSNSLTGQTTYTTAGWITTEGLGNATDSDVVVGKIAQSTLKNGNVDINSGATIVPSTTAAQTINISAGYEGARTVVIQPMSAGTSAVASVTASKAAATPTLADETTSVDSKTRITVTATTATTDINKYYISVKITAPETDFVAADIHKNVSTAGYLSTTAQIAIADNAVKTTTATKLYYLPLNSASATIYAAKRATVPTAASSSATLSGKTSLGSVTPVSAASGISTYYIPFTVNAPETTLTNDNVSKNITPGYLSDGNQLNVNGAISSTSATYYMPITSGALSKGAGTVTANGTPGSVTMSTTSSAPATGYYIKIEGYGAVGVGTAGWLPTSASTTSNLATQYIKLNTAALDASATPGVVTVSEGYVPAGGLSINVPRGSISSGTTNMSYENNPTIVPSGGYLYLSAGYYPNTQLSLDSMLGGDADVAATTDAHILAGFAAYDVDGNLLTGAIQTYDGSYTSF